MTVDPYLDGWRWRTPAQIAELKVPGLPQSKRGVNAVIAKQNLASARDSAGRCLSRPTKGGGREYHEWAFFFVREARQFFIAQEPPAEAAAKAAAEEKERRSKRVNWPWYDRLSDKLKAQAERRRAILDEVELRIAGGEGKDIAVCRVAERHGIGKTSIYNWFDWVRGFDRADWLPLLASRYQGKTRQAECSPEAWDYLKGEYLRPSRPSFEACYDRLVDVANKNGWTIPSARTLRRRVASDLPPELVIKRRQGRDAAKQLYPSQKRDRSGLVPLQAVNADGHVADVFTKWEDGSVSRPVLLVIQDLYSGKIMAWRIARSESAHVVQLALMDLFKAGIPDEVVLDNGRGFASKWITGGTPNRNRFKVKPGDPAGVLTKFGVRVHWANPYSGQSKPIERAFRDFCDRLWRHAAFDGAYTGNRPDAKPENYRSKAVPIELFRQVVDREIERHNAKEGRRSEVCGGRLSFDQAYKEGMARRDLPLVKGTQEQLRLFMMCGEQVTARKPAASLHLMGNRYWAEFLVRYMGKKLTVRFDPDDLHAGVEVYRLDGAHLGHAECLEPAGFFDLEAARRHSKARQKYLRGIREQAEAERILDAETVARMHLDCLPEPSAPAPENPKVVRMVPKGGAGARPAPEEGFSDDEQTTALRNALDLLQQQKDIG